MKVGFSVTSNKQDIDNLAIRATVRYNIELEVAFDSTKNKTFFIILTGKEKMITKFFKKEIDLIDIEYRLSYVGPIKLKKLN